MTEVMFAKVDTEIIHKDHYGPGENAYESHAYVGLYERLKGFEGGTETRSFETSSDIQFLFKALDEGYHVVEDLFAYIQLSNGFESCGDVVFIHSTWKTLYPYAEIETIYFFASEEEMNRFNQHFNVKLVDEHPISLH